MQAADPPLAAAAPFPFPSSPLYAGVGASLTLAATFHLPPLPPPPLLSEHGVACVLKQSTRRTSRGSNQTDRSLRLCWCRPWPSSPWSTVRGWLGGGQEGVVCKGVCVCVRGAPPSIAPHSKLTLPHPFSCWHVESLPLGVTSLQLPLPPLLTVLPLPPPLLPPPLPPPPELPPELPPDPKLKELPLANELPEFCWLFWPRDGFLYKG